MSAWRTVADALLSAVLAPPCAVCDRVLDRPLDGAVCETCWGSVVRLAPPLCRACGDPLPSWRVASVSEGLCPRCRRGARLVAQGCAIGAYDGVLRQIIHALKYDGRRSIAPTLAAMMADCGRGLLSDADLVVPVPLHPARERERGFNQAQELANNLGLPVRPYLVRHRRTHPQVDLPAAQRHRNVKDAFHLTSRHSASHALSDKTVVLVDDVTTTGATVNACARVLREAGVREIRVLTAARVVCAPR